ncbi:hypothetical protein S83_067031, partial [Arachis hypogaea]
SKQSLGRAILQAARIGGFRHHGRKDNNSEMNSDCLNGSVLNGVKMNHLATVKGKESESVSLVELSMLLSDAMRSTLYASLPALERYITFNPLSKKHALAWIEFAGDRRGAVFGSLVEAPLRPSNKKYQGTNSTFVFTNISGHPVIYRPTGLNRYFTLCNSEFLAIGGGSHFALYLDGDLLAIFLKIEWLKLSLGNPCLANSQDFEVKEVE